MRPVTLQGNSSEEKFTHVEKILTRIIDRLPQVVTCKVPPIPVSFHTESAEADEILARYIFPVRGKLVQAAVRVGDLRGNKTVLLEASVQTKHSLMAETFELKGQDRLVKLDLPVEAGTTLTLKSLSAVGDVWLGLLYRVAEDKNEIVQVALEQMEEAHARIYD